MKLDRRRRQFLPITERRKLRRFLMTKPESEWPRRHAPQVPERGDLNIEDEGLIDLELDLPEDEMA